MSIQVSTISDVRGEAALRNLRVLALTSGGTAPEERYILRPLEFAKARWNWHIDVLAGSNRVEAVERLAAPHGRIFARLNRSGREAAAWESDPAVVATVNARLKEAENLTGVPIGQVVLAADSKLGRAFVDPVINLPPSSTADHVIADNCEPFRAVRRLFKFADDLIETTRPQLIYGYEWAKPWFFALWLAAQRRGIPCIVIRRSKIRSNSCFLTPDRLMFNLAASEQVQHAKSSERAIEYIRAFREQPQMVQYIANKWRQVEERTWLNWHTLWARAAATDAARALMLRGNRRRRANVQKLVDFNRRMVTARLQQRYLRAFTNAELESMNYIYFPMHKETDQPVNFQAAPWFDQSNTVRLLASVLPHGYFLLVREHRHNFGLRPSAYYKELSRLPNVILVDAFDQQFKYIKNADLVLTENGSSGWEGLLLGRRVLTLSRTFYDGAALTTKVENISQLGSAILQSLAAPAIADQAAYDRTLAAMIDAEFETTFLPDDEESVLRHFTTTIAPMLRNVESETLQPAG